jgi:hypothetical protein
LSHQFVEFIPEKLKKGTVYVSIEYATATHLCCCGCGHEIVTPISPTGWSLSFDGESISLDPSIGNWSLPCGSHYWIRNNRVRWAAAWSKEEIDAGRAHDKVARERYFNGRRVNEPEHLEVTHAALPPSPVGIPWRRIKSWLRFRRGRPRT